MLTMDNVSKNFLIELMLLNKKIAITVQNDYITVKYAKILHFVKNAKKGIYIMDIVQINVKLGSLLAIHHVWIVKKFANNARIIVIVHSAIKDIFYINFNSLKIVQKDILKMLVIENVKNAMSHV